MQRFWLAWLAAGCSARAATTIADFEIRALPNAPNGYAPAAVDCPSSRPSVRLADSLSPQENAFLTARRGNIRPAMQDLLTRANITGFDVNTFFQTTTDDNQLPNIGIAISGGGYRALMNGAGALQAFDSRESNGTTKGHLGGLLQSATYLSGLSGGSWLVGSIYFNNFTTISNLISEQSSTWNLKNSIFEGPPSRGIAVLSTADYFKTIYDQVQAKSVNYSTTITDYWSRAISFQMVNASDGGPSYTFSSIAQQDGFSNGEQPFPIVIADERKPGQLIISGNSSIFEFNPYEMGTWDPTVYSFAPLEYLGGNFSNGTVPQGQECVRGFDNAGYIIGTSSSLFNSLLLGLNSTSVPKVLQSALQAAIQGISSTDEDIAAYEPHPFQNWNPTGRSDISNTTRLTLVDGGLDLQNIPLHPLIQPLRKVDVIFAVDSSADTTYNWPNGTAMVATYERSLNSSGLGNGTSFPSIPDTNTFINLGLNTRPTFFGCNASNTSSPTPLVVYLPNAPYVSFSNVSTFDPSYNDTQRNNIILNGYYGATRANSTADPEWPACVGCAILNRSFDRNKTTVPEQCQRCFTRYCWNGTLANQASTTNYEPKLANATQATSASIRVKVSYGFMLSSVALTSILLSG